MYKPVITATLSLNKKEDKSVKIMLFTCLQKSCKHISIKHKLATLIGKQHSIPDSFNTAQPPHIYCLRDE